MLLCFSLLYLRNTPLFRYAELMTATRAKHPLYALAELIELAVRNESKRRSGKAAAVYAYRTAAIKQFLTKGYSESHALMLPAA